MKEYGQMALRSQVLKKFTFEKETRVIGEIKHLTMEELEAARKTATTIRI